MNIKCAVYIRKSTEKGLDQNFNSLHNQEEACKNYILSQAFNKWEYHKTYEDAAISGGTTNRPALKQMLKDVKHGKVNTIIVYKVDRLSRTIVDFHNIMKILEEYDCSFVSITQSFDTSNSMGKLTLNMLLSFAQFEREVSAERVRDKIASSKQKGYWMGGIAPLGYEAINKELVINKEDAELIKTIFNKYLELKSVYTLKDWLDNNNYKTKERISKKGIESGNNPFTTSNLHNILTNPTYIGRIKHLDTSYKGRHKAILSKETWDNVQTTLASNLCNGKLKGRKKPQVFALLRGLAFYQDKRLFYRVSEKKGYTNYYYIYDGKYYLNAPYLEIQATNAIKLILQQSAFYYPPEIYNKLKFIDIESLSKVQLQRLLNIMVKQITIENQLSLRLDFYQKPEKLEKFMSNNILEFDKEANPNIYSENDTITLHKTIDLNNIRNNNRIIGNVKLKEPNAEELAAIATAFKYKKLYDELGSVKQVASTLKQGARRIYKYLNLAYLSPTIINNILDNKLPNITVTQLMDIASKTYIWAEQEEVLNSL